MAEIKKISTELQLLDKFLDTSGDAGTSGQVLTSTGTGINWVSGGSLPGGPYLPLSAGSSYPLTGDLYLKTTNDASVAREKIIWQTSQGTNRSFIRVGGSYANNALEFGTGNSILGMILHANAGLSIGTTVATTLPPASGLLVQGKVGIGTTSPSSVLHVNAPASGGGAIFSTQGYNYATVSQLISSADAVFGGGVIAGSTAAQLIKTVADVAHFVKVQITDGITFHTNVTGAAGTTLNRTANERMRITSAGNVGIGTDNPGSKLEVKTSGFNSAVEIDNSDSQYSIVQHNALGATKGFSGYNSGFMIFGGEAGVTTRLQAGGNYAATILTNGNVGIGTTSPGAKLDVVGSASSQPLIKIENSDVGGTAPSIEVKGTGSASSAMIDIDRSATGRQSAVRYKTNGSVDWYSGIYYDGGSSQSNFGIGSDRNKTNQKLVITTSGNVGIGTTNPANKLHVSSDTTYDGIQISGASIPTLAIVDTTNNAKLTAYTRDSDATIGTETNHHLTINTNNIERVRITQAGRVGIGTTSPTQKLDVRGGAGVGTLTHAIFTGTTSRGLELRTRSDVSGGQYSGCAEINSADSEGTGGDLALSSNGNIRMFIEGGGNVGIGTTSPAVKFQVHRSDDTVTQAGITNSGAGAVALYFDASNGDMAGGDYMQMGQNNDLSGQIQMEPNAGAFNIKTGTGSPTRFTVLQNGNVGIGTTSPGSKLEVVGNANITSTSGTTLTIEAKNPTAFNDPRIEFVTWNEASGASSGKIQLTNGSYNNNDMAFFTETSNSVTEKMRITSAGRVGIGTTSPQDLLEVRAADGVTGVIRVQGGNNTVTAIGEVNSRLDFGSNDGSVASPFVGGRIASVTELTNGARTGLAFSTYLQSRPGDDLMEFVRITSEGNVGIGTSSPSKKLTVYGGNDNGIWVDSSGSQYTSIAWGNNGTEKANIAYDNTNANFAITAYGSSDTVFSNNGSERMRISPSGNVGIGTTSPDSKLDVKGASATPADGNQTLSITNTTGGTQLNIGTAENSYGWIETREGSTLRNLLLNPNGGNVGIGTTSPTGYRLVVENTSEDLLKLHNSTDGLDALIAFTNPGGTLGRIQGIDNGGLAFDVGDNAGGIVSNAMFIKNNGKVGIGTTSPNAKLEVTGDIEDNWAGRFENTNSGGYGILAKIAGTSANERIFEARVGSSTKMLISGDGKVTFAGDVQIDGTLSGAGAFVPVGGGTFTGNVTIGDNSASEIFLAFNSSATDFALGANGSNFMIGTSSDLDSGNLITLSGANGNFGIGTTSPGAKLDVSGNYGDVIKAVSGSQSITTNFVAPSGGTGLNNIISTAGKFNIGTSDAQPFNLLTSSISRIAILSGGNVGIGITNPSYKLEVSGTLGVNRTDGIIFAGSAAGGMGNKITADTSNDLIFSTSLPSAPYTVSEKMRIANNGATTFTSTVTATNFILSSDERLKENVEKVCDNRVKADWKTFELKTDKGQKRYGVIAQELEKTNPEFVREDSQGFKSVAYIDLLIAKIAELEARLEKLEK